MQFDPEFSDQVGLIRIPLLLVLALLVLSGCAGDGRIPEVDSAPRTLVYLCGDMELVVHTRGEQASLYLPQNEYALALVPSKSGQRYVGYDIYLTLQGEGAAKADLELGSRHYRACVLDSSRIPWEEARRRGVDFRAVGQEPGWYLEIEHGAQLLFVYNYGSGRLLVEAPDPESEGAESVYEVIHKGQKLRVELRVEHCQDVMSGELFDNSAVVIVDDREYRGCGMTLSSEW